MIAGLTLGCFNAWHWVAKEDKAMHDDNEERTFWKQYMKAYEACLSATSTKLAPWYVVPADNKKTSRLIISEIVLDVFKSLKLAYPKPTAKHRQELRLIRERLAK